MSPHRAPAVPIALIVGLGNPGDDYRDTRHNVGFRVVDAFARQQRCDWQRKSRYPAELGALDWISEGGSQKIWLLKPQTFMNRSGEAVGRFCKEKAILPQQLVVIHDELDFPLGTIKGGFDRGAAGHNGVQSIIDHLASTLFYRIRFGIGKARGEGEGHVLGAFRQEEKKTVDALVDALVQALRVVLDCPWDKALQAINTISLLP